MRRPSISNFGKRIFGELKGASYPFAISSSCQTGTEGAIVNIIDQRVFRPTPQFFTYSLSKSALWAATLTMAQAFAPQGIRVNAVGPGPVSPNHSQGEAGFALEVRACRSPARSRRTISPTRFSILPKHAT